MRLLLADDERELSRALEAVLKHNNYFVDVVNNGADAMDYALSENYDGLILDIMMPKKNGLEVVRELRERGIPTPVLLLTARAEIDQRIEGLDAGADDYLTKPFAMGELLARVRALTRRREAYTPELLSFEGMTLNLSTFELQGPGGSFRLGNKEFQMMEMLMSHPGSVISADQFMERIWGYDSEAEINIVWTYLSYLRKKITALEAPVQIRAIRGAGYRLEATKKNE